MLPDKVKPNLSAPTDDATLKAHFAAGNWGYYSHKIDEYEIRCAAKQARVLAEIEFGPDGAEVERYPEADAAWDDIRPTSLSAYIQPIVCNGDRAEGANAASIKAYIDAGRGQ